MGGVAGGKPTRLLAISSHLVQKFLKFTAPKVC
jgi:hypothetical protein